MRRGKELPSSSALDSPSVMSKLATPTPAIHSDMSHVIVDPKGLTWHKHKLKHQNTTITVA